MTQSWYNSERVGAPGSVVLANWLAADPARAARNGVAPSVRNYGESMVDLFGAGPMSSAGMAVTPQTAQQVSVVYACCALIAGGISTMPLRFYERRLDPVSREYQRRPVDDQQFSWLFNEQPCAAFTAASMWELACQSELLRGDGFAYLSRNSAGKIEEVLPLLWGAVTATRRPNGRLMYRINDGYIDRVVDQDDMLHFAGFGFDGERSPSVIKHAARQAIGNALAMDEYSGRFFAGGAHPSIVLESDKAMKDGGITALQEAFANKYAGVANAHRMPLVLTDGLKAREISLSAEDAQLLDARKFQVIDICRAFGVPPHLVGETSASTSWGSGIEAMGRGFVTYTLNRRLARYEQELNRKLFPQSTQYFCEFDRSALQAGDSKAQAEVDRFLLGGPGSGPGIASQNELRRRRHLPPIEGGDRVYWPDTGATAPSGTTPPTEE